MWGTWQAAPDHVLMNEALAYTGYDVYVEGLFGLDTYLASLNVAQRAQRAPTMAVTSAQHLSVQWATSGAMIKSRARRRAALVQWRVRLLQSSQEGKTSRSTSTACRSSGPASTSPAPPPARRRRARGPLSALAAASDCQRYSLYHLADGRQAARRGVGALPRLHPAARRALRRDPARVAVRGAPEVVVGIPAYWASRRASSPSTASTATTAASPTTPPPPSSPARSARAPTSAWRRRSATPSGTTTRSSSQEPRDSLRAHSRPALAAQGAAAAARVRAHQLPRRR